MCLPGSTHAGIGLHNEIDNWQACGALCWQENDCNGWHYKISDKQCALFQDCIRHGPYKRKCSRYNNLIYEQQCVPNNPSCKIFNVGKCYYQCDGDGDDGNCCTCHGYVSGKRGCRCNDTSTILRYNILL